MVLTESRPDAVEAAPILRIENLRVSLQGRDATVDLLSSVSLDICPGETIGVVGESGSGKTMTAMAVMRLLPESATITGGHIWLDKDDLVTKTEPEMTAIRGRRIAMIPQDPMTSLNPVLSVGDQLVESVEKIAGVRDRKAALQRAEELLRLVNIADPRARLRSYPHQMSGGMRQRVVGAIAIAGNPSVLIADEPTTSLDATVQLQYLKLLKRLQAATDAAILFITHDFGIVAEMCDRVAVMYAGKVVETGRVGDIFDAPSHPYTKALIESVPAVDREINVLPTIPGNPPGPHEMPSGCRFAPRCPRRFDQCVVDPPEVSVGTDHHVRCWLRAPEAV